MRQKAITWWQGGLLAAFLAVFALAFSLAASQTAYADDDLAAGEVELTAQAATSWPLTVYKQYGSDPATKVTTYSATEFAKLKASTDAVSGLYIDSNKWYVTTATEYVTLEDLLADAGLHWASGATVTYTNGTDTYSFSYDDVQDMDFYPKTESDARESSTTEWTGLVFGLKNTLGAEIGDGKTAADTQKAAEGTSVDTDAITAVSGTTADHYKGASGTTVDKGRFVTGVTAITVTYPDSTQTVYRLYNPNNGDHHYTVDAYERDMLVGLGWNSEGTGWTARVLSNTPVYRLYNPYSGDHHYTTSADERDNLSSIGWNYEGIAWYSDDAKTKPLYRLYNKYLTAGTHHYTLDVGERDFLVSIGWADEDIAWYAVA